MRDVIKAYKPAQERRLMLLKRAGLAASAAVLLYLVFLAQRSVELPRGMSASLASLCPTHQCGGSPAAAAAALPPPACDLEVASSQWADSCQLLTDACVDQGSSILYGAEHRMNESSKGTAPYEIAPEPDYRRYIFLHRHTAGRDYRYGNPPIRVRPASSQEGAAYLADPVFSSCTVPIIWYPMWLANLAHFFRDNAAKLYGVLQATPWAPHIKLVLVTAEGHAAPPMNYDVAQPMTPLRVETWADFSARLPSRQAPGGSGFAPADLAVQPSGAGVPPLSYEGGPQRCFRRLFVCNGGINITTWPLHGLGQRLVRHYSGQLAAEAAGAAGAVPEEAAAKGSPANEAAQEEVAMASGALHSASPAAGSGEEGVLRVVFHKRSSPDRQLLNAAELVQRCNGWRHRTAAGQRLRARCWEVEPTDLFSGMVAAQQADVFVGVHGANMANGWLMRPGSSMIELQPYGFDAGAAHLQYPLFNEEDAESTVLWWVISVCDPQAWTPGRAEAAGTGRAVNWPKNRNLVVRWEALETALRTAVDAGGDMAAYRRQRWAQGRWWWWMGPGGSMEYAGKGRFTQMRCPGAPDADYGDGTAVAGAEAG